MLEIGTRFNAEEKLWEGPDIKPFFNPKVSIGQVIIRMMSMHGPKIAQVSDDFGVQSTFNEILIKTIRVAQNLQKLKVPRKGVFGIIAHNNPDLAPILFAAFCLGCPVSPFDPAFGKVEIKSIISITKPSVFFCEVSLYDLLETCLKELDIKADIFTFTGQRGKSKPVEVLFAETNIESDFLLVDVDGEFETAIIAGSFGISGQLEGICLSHALLLDKSTRLTSTAAGDVLFAFSSIYWLSGIANILKATYFGATRIITTKPFSAEYLLRLIEKYKITHIFASLHQINLALTFENIKSVDLSSVKSVALNSQKVPRPEYASIRQYFKNAVPYNMFGLSELGGAISVSRGFQLSLDGTGKLVNGIKVKIVDEYRNRLGVGERGQICVHCAYYFNGYYGKEGKNSIVDEENFLKTGDIGYFDADGYLHVLGREIDMIKYQNFQVSPKEIESVLNQNPAIKSSCVVGVASSDVTLVTALIVRYKDLTISENEVHSLVADKFDESYKLRGGVYFVDALPLTPSGKVIRRLAKAIAEKEFSSRNKDSKKAT
ncbi:probable 4-coumarate--CoA ligase 3 [Sitodiplosis mosellana]|uniref:probable 4-coumarate--CoA ligase 3 n=1 Tax=Sitodiplosis mosellana TaxID=263140 RepID=UPI0024437FD6|nr:probable 4-coumarate--CoA ligase 3 [Sitodiplosis mosellana]